MKLHSFPMRALSLIALLLVLALPAPAQLQSGNLYGTVKSLSGEILAGVTVTLTGAGAPQVQVTDAQGRFRFPGLAPGSDYAVKAELQGFSPLEASGIVINVGRNTNIELQLPSPVTGVIDVVAEKVDQLLIDPRRFGPNNTVTNADLERIPTARDPWVVLQSTSGVLIDRVNVGGNESGQQAQLVGPGSGGDQAAWSVDGVVITDMAALGSSPGYYDFDAFEEMQVTTGGSDASIATGGVVLNMVTKRGTNQWRGSGRYYTDRSNWQSSLNFNRSDLGQAGPFNGGKAQTAFKQGNRIDKISDYGAELGGPIVKDRLWIWGSYAKPQIDLFTIKDFSDKTTLKDWNAKLNTQVTVSNSATGFVWQSEKIKNGRNASPTRPQETTWNQSNFGPSPTTWKVEDTQIFNSSFFATGMYSRVNGGFQLAPQGGDALAFRDTSLTWHNSFILEQIKRPQTQYKLDGSSFFNTGSLSNELKYGAGYRNVEQSTLFSWPGGGFNLGGRTNNLLLLSRDANPRIKADYTNVYAQDIVALGNLTANLGVRWDRQTGRNEASSSPANPVFPGLLPAVNYPGQGSGFTWNDVTPRLGLTYALGAERKTLLRASYSRFADQLGTGTAGWLNPVGGLGYRYFFTSNTGTPTLLPGQLIREVAPPSGNVNPSNFGFLQSNAVNHNLSAPLTDELLLSAEHALLPEFVVGLNLSYRKYHNTLEAERLVFDAEDPFATELLGSVGRVHQRSDYVEQTSDPFVAPDGRTYTVNYWELRPGVSTRNGFLLTNGDRQQRFEGAALTFNKRLANRWMMRGNVSWQDWKWQIPNSENQDPTDTVAGGIVDGTDVLQGSGTTSGPKGSVFINSRWSYNVNGMYQIAPDHPWGFNLAANLTGRQGYPLRYVQRIVRSTIVDAAGTGIDIPINADPNAFRYPDIHVVDFRVEKELTFNQVGITLGVDVFNALNKSYVLQRQSVIANSGSPVSNADYVTEILSPRVYRLGARFSFR
ncbi:MAG TPA: carboxypeptidase regulatory-like domain-containing protein [Thermoanaerobaculia bacterium]|jgi:hypothetical protein|nr:carboxypeptidase regulatory-like domain-containing protein [Thermoanaerobaculia bacterium]